MVEQIGTDNSSVSHQVDLLTPSGPADAELIGHIRRGVEAVNADTVRLHTYLSRFL